LIDFILVQPLMRRCRQAAAAATKLLLPPLLPPPPLPPRCHCHQESNSGEERDGVFLIDVIVVQPLKITVV
jgi:hypothetical protein